MSTFFTARISQVIKRRSIISDGLIPILDTSILVVSTSSLLFLALIQIHGERSIVSK